MWINGVNKIQFVNKIIILSIFLMIAQIVIGSIFSPMSQFKARNLLKNSNIDFFSSLIKEGKFINVIKGLTIFIEKEMKMDHFQKFILMILQNLIQELFMQKMEC